MQFQLKPDNSNRFSGSINVTAGTLDVSSVGALGIPGGAGTTTMSAGATLSVHGGISLAQPLVLSGSGAGGLGDRRARQGALTLPGRPSSPTAPP